MRYTQSEKMEIIRLVEGSSAGTRQTLRELDIAPSTFYAWYEHYERDGSDGLATRKPNANTFWNRIPEEAREEVRAIALERPELTPRELAWHIVDREGWYISESSVYRILRAFDLLPEHTHVVIVAGKHFQHPTHAVHELWQTDFTYFQITGWGWYYLETILDDYSRYIVHWKLRPSMNASDVTDLVGEALAITGAGRPRLRHRPRLLSDNGPCYLSGELAQWLADKRMAHTRGAPYHPQTQGKIERYHRTMKNRILLDNYFLPGALEDEVGRFVQYYNHERVHESLDNVTPADVYNGRRMTILDRRERIKRITLQERRTAHFAMLSQTIPTNTLPGQTVTTS
jgi:transposase InsO family protein